MDTTVDNNSVKLTDAEEVREVINSMIKQYRELLGNINAAIAAHEAEITALKEQKDRLVKLIPNNQPLR